MTIVLIVLGFVLLALAAIGVRDLTQKKHAVTRNFPVVGHFRYFFEELGQPLRQYFFSSDLEERPYNRVTRSWVYASAKGAEQLRRVRVAGRSPRARPDAHPAVDVPDLDAGLGGASAAARHRRVESAALSSEAVREYFRHELRCALAECRQGAVARRQRSPDAT